MEKINDIFVPLEIAKKLKEIGFDMPCMSYYYNENLIIDLQENENSNVYLLTDAEFSNLNENEDCYSAPTWEQLKSWFEQKGIKSHIFWNVYLYEYRYTITFLTNEDIWEDINYVKGYDSYKKARYKLVETLIKIYKQHKQ